MHGKMKYHEQGGSMSLIGNSGPNPMCRRWVPRLYGLRLALAGVRPRPVYCLAVNLRKKQSRPFSRR